MIGRRHLAAMLGVLAASGALAQPKAKRRLAIFVAAGAVSIIREDSQSEVWRRFFAELRRLGHVEGENLTIARWSAENDTRRFESLAREIVASRPDIVFAWSAQLALALRDAGADMPVVVAGINLGQSGVVQNYARPGGNMTGVSFDDTAGLVGKRIEIVHEIRPKAHSIGFLAARLHWEGYGETVFLAPAVRRGLKPVPMVLEAPINEAAYRQVFAEATRNGLDLLVADETTVNYVHRVLITSLAAAHRVPAIFHDRAFIEAGGLLSYGYESREAIPFIVGCLARVLSGGKPADVPVHVFDKVRLVVNLPAARALALTIPPAIVASADEVIE